MQVHPNAPTAKQPYWRLLRKGLDPVLLLVGMAIILSVTLLKQEFREMSIIVLGVCLIEVAIWKLARKLLPNQRKYHALRVQTDQFLRLIRQLNTVALRLKESDTPERRQAVEEIREAMLQMVERITIVAGKTDPELAEAGSLAQKNGLSRIPR